MKLSSFLVLFAAGTATAFVAPSVSSSRSTELAAVGRREFAQAAFTGAAAFGLTTAPAYAVRGEDYVATIKDVGQIYVLVSVYRRIVGRWWNE